MSKLLVWPPAVLLLVWPPAVAANSATHCSCGRECCEDALGAASGTACVAPVVLLFIGPRTDLPGVTAGLLMWLPAKLLVWLPAKLLVWLPAKLLVLPPAVVPVVATAEEACWVSASDANATSSEFAAAVTVSSGRTSTGLRPHSSLLPLQAWLLSFAAGAPSATTGSTVFSLVMGTPSTFL